MNKASRQSKEGSFAHLRLTAGVLSAAVLIAACDGGGQGVQLGDGQSPDPESLLHLLE